MIRKIIFIIMLLIIGGLAGASLYFQRTLTSPAGSDAAIIEFTVDENFSRTEVVHELRSKGLIRSEQALLFYLKIRRWHLKPGRYKLNKTMNSLQIASKISHGEMEKVKITIPEGWRLTQIADRLEANKLVNKQEFLDATEGQEGYLFPDTYYISTDLSVSEIVSMMRENFSKKTTGLTITPDNIILASIVEREAKKDQDRPLIAGVYLNRILMKMELQADPTIQYAKGSWDAIAVSDYNSVISPFNTYLHKGYPPGPICNPGMASINAVLDAIQQQKTNPTGNQYLYFFSTSDGTTYYSKTYEEFKQKKAQYLK